MNSGQARNRIRVSWVFAAVGALFAPVLYLAEPTLRQDTDPLAVILSLPIGAYAFWALFWGIVGLASYWKGSNRRVGVVASRIEMLRQRISPGLTVFRGVVSVLFMAVFLIEALFYFTALLTASYVYGLFGGGIRQFRRHRQIARSPGTDTV